MNFNLFYEESENLQTPIHLRMIDSDVDFYPHFFSQSESDILYKELMNTISWKQEQIKYYGKIINLPRLTAWHGDKGLSYTYSGINVIADEWIEVLLRIKAKIESVSNAKFNSVLLNLYRNGKDSVAWHSDDEVELGVNPIIGSVSFGSTRNFQFQHRKNTDLREAVKLAHGDFLLMKGTTQHFWQHQIPKTSPLLEPRINLTFRIIGE